MGMFANESPGVGMRLAPDTYSAGDSGFAAMGKPIPFFRRQAADNHLKEMGVLDSEERWNCVSRVADKLERDQPHAAMDIAFEYVDVTGCYRLLAVLLCAAPA